ncbi:MAG TPA: manganese catalase family protein, partial [Rubrobacteraceae bacterium]|nr:manganese catalase family protein [Rubrobacteraceae bacterium]
TKFPHARKFMDRGFHRILYRFSPDDYRQIGEIWNGPQADTGEPREVLDDPPEGGEVPNLTPAPPLYAPEVDSAARASATSRLSASSPSPPETRRCCA